jgi:hypothetical protein
MNITFQAGGIRLGLFVQDRTGLINIRRCFKMKKDTNDYFNETSNTAAGINTPPENEDKAPTDMISGAVGEILDNVRHAFQHDDKDEEALAETRRQRLDGEPDPEVRPVAKEGTPVDQVAPPTDIVNGTDLLNGYSGEEDSGK